MRETKQRFYCSKDIRVREEYVILWSKQADLSDVDENMILVVSVFLTLLRLFIYFLLESEGKWVERYITPLLQYREVFDFCSFVFFVLTIYVFIFKSGRKQKRLFASILINFINTIVCWDYVPGLCLKIQEMHLWLVSKLKTSEGYVLGFGLLMFLVIVIFCWRRWEGEFWQHMREKWDSLKKDGSCINWLILLVLGSFFLLQVVVEIGYSAGIKVTRTQRLIKSSFWVLAIVSAASLVYICIQIVKRRKNGQAGAFTVIFLDVCLSLWGIATIRFYNGKLMMSGKAFRNLILAEVEIIISTAIILVGVLLWKMALKYIGSNKGYKVFDERGRRFQFAICVSGFIILFVFIVLFIVFSNWGGQINSYFSGLDNQAASFEDVMEFWGVIVLFAVVGIIVIGGISLFVYEVFKAVLKRNKKPSEWVVLFASFVLTGLSMYIYYHIEPKGKMDGIAEDVAGVFAFPVVLMAWYIIMTGLLESLSGLLKDPSEIKKKLAEEMEQLILDSISAIFAPLYFSANYLATLRDAIMEDDGKKKEGRRRGLQTRCKNCYILLKNYFKRIGGMRRCRMARRGKD